MDEHVLYKCTRMQTKAPSASAYDPNCIDYARYGYEQYVNA